MIRSAGVLVVLCGGMASATPIVWSTDLDALHGNGHAYELWGVPAAGPNGNVFTAPASPRLNWQAARDKAPTITPPAGFSIGRLAMIADQNEFDFVALFLGSNNVYSILIGGTAELGEGPMAISRVFEFPSGNQSNVLQSPFTGIASYFIEWEPIPIPGDVNSDQAVNVFDLNLVASHWGESGPMGDANHDNAVDVFDVNLISANWTASGAVAPEPSSIALAVVALLMMAQTIVRRRLRRNARNFRAGPRPCPGSKVANR